MTDTDAGGVVEGGKGAYSRAQSSLPPGSSGAAETIAAKTKRYRRPANNAETARREAWGRMWGAKVRDAVAKAMREAE